MRWIFLWILVGACRDGSAPPPAPAPDRRAPVHAGSATGGTETPRPILAAEQRESTEPIPEVTTEKAFEVEAVDRGWKTTTEAEVRRRVPSVTDLECHTTMCKLTLVGNPRELTKVLDEIETERSLRGIADSILLGAPETRTDGTIAVRAFARFTR
jgi:hypothetical protein